MDASEGSFGLKCHPESSLGASGLASSTFATSAIASSSTPNTSIVNSLCYNCGSAAHKARHCSQPKKCFKCGKIGHSMKDCRIIAIKDYPKPARLGRQGTRTPRHKATQPRGGPVQSIFEKGYEEIFGTSTPAEAPPDLIDLSSDDEYKPQNALVPVTPIDKQLYSNVIQGLPSHLPNENQPVELAEPTLLDQVTNEEKVAERVPVTLHRKRKGRKGRSTTHDLTPFLAY